MYKFGKLLPLSLCLTVAIGVVAANNAFWRLLFLVVLLHEISHAWWLVRREDMQLTGFLVTPLFGFVTYRTLGDLAEESSDAQRRIALAGPLGGLALVALSANLFMIAVFTGHMTVEELGTFALLGVLVNSQNLLPIPLLDGWWVRGKRFGPTLIQMLEYRRGDEALSGATHVPPEAETWWEYRRA